MIKSVHHVAIICSNYEKSKHFYTEVLGLEILQEVYREDRRSYKLDLAVNGHYQVELFSFPDPPMRTSRPEACGVRHLAFAVDHLDEAKRRLEASGVYVEEIRTDPHTDKRFTFFADPDDLPLELYEV